MSVRGELREQPDAMRLQDLTLEGPERKTDDEFNREMMIDGDDYKYLEISLLHYVRSTGISGGISRDLALAAKALFPKRFEDLEEENSEWRGTMARVADTKRSLYEEASFGDSHANEMLKLLAYHKIIFRRNETDYQPNEKVWGEIKLKLNSELETKPTMATVAAAALFPERISELDLKNLQQKYRSSLDDQRSIDKSRQRRGMKGEFVDLVFYTKFLFPELVREVLTDEDLASIKQFLEQSRSNRRHVNSNFTYYYELMKLKVIVAKEVKITDKGLELIMSEKESFKQETPPRPERKELS